jgi:hypothetical protein
VAEARSGDVASPMHVDYQSILGFFRLLALLLRLRVKQRKKRFLRLQNLDRVKCFTRGWEFLRR